MAKLFLVLLIATVAVLIEGGPLSEDVVEQAAAGNWNAIHKLMTRDTGSEEENTDEDGQNNHYAQSISSFYTSTNNNGKVEKNGGVFEVVDNNGKISKRYFKLP